jgi:hypothetical protein
MRSNPSRDSEEMPVNEFDLVLPTRVDIREVGFI